MPDTDNLELKFDVLQRWLKDPAAEFNLWTLGSRVGLGNTLVSRVISELISDGLIAAKERGFPRTYYLCDREGAEAALRSRNESTANGGGT